jgi:hypothetical protein
MAAMGTINVMKPAGLVVTAIRAARMPLHLSGAASYGTGRHIRFTELSAAELADLL